MASNCDNDCGLFDFMAKDIGIQVLHPGGYEATNTLLSCCELDETSHVLDVACGSGSSAFHVAKNYGCRVTGVDISDYLIGIANQRLQKEGGNIVFKAADAMQLPFEKDSFDAVISQAFFVLIDEGETALHEMVRVLRPGGFLGALEKSWFEMPPRAVYDDLVENTCSAFIPRVKTFNEWESFFGGEKLTHAGTEKYPMTSGIGRMFRTEGWLNTVKIMTKMMANPPMRKRMMRVQQSFGAHSDYLGYGIYCYQKN